MIGYGKDTVGGSGGRVYEVTEPGDGWGEGTFRGVCSRLTSEPAIVRVLVPEVLLAKPVTVERAVASRKSYVAANPQGVTIKGSFWPAAYQKAQQPLVEQVVISGFRFRGTMAHGSDFNPQTGGNPLQCYGIRNLLVVGNSISGGLDQCLNLQHCGNATVDRNIISESGLNGDGGQFHGESYHNYGGHASNLTGGVTFSRNLWINHRTRMPNVDGPHPAQLVNNWIQNFEKMASESWMPSVSNVVGNVWCTGPQSRTAGGHNLLRNESRLGQEHAPYLEGNVYTWLGEDITDQQQIYDMAMPYREKGLADAPYTMPPVEVMPAGELRDYLIDNAGVLERDAVDLRAIEDLKNGTGRYGFAGFEEGYGPVAPPLELKPTTEPTPEPAAGRRWKVTATIEEIL